MDGNQSADSPPLFWGRDIGFVEYVIPLPADVVGPFAGLTLRMEAGSRPAEVTQSAQGVQRPSDVLVSINGVMVTSVTLPDLYVNANGILSRINQIGPGEHGELLTIEVPEALLPLIEMRARAAKQIEVRLEV